MGIRQTLEVVNGLVAEGVIGRYAIAGAVAAYNYIEAAVTEDLDILISFGPATGQPSAGLILLNPIVSHLRIQGYTEWRKEGIMIEGWPVQFIPVATELDAEALDRALDIELEMQPGAGGIPTRVLRPEHLVATSLKVGRPKDFARIAQFLGEGAVDRDALCDVLDRHGLMRLWAAFCNRVGLANPCG
jgi:hypothetical protein